jgi:hypothetical protein
MKIVCEYKEYSYTADGALAVTFTAKGQEKDKARQVVAELQTSLLAAKEPVKYEISIDKYSPKRSLNANAYCWALISQLAQVLKTKKEDVYREYVKELGICQTVEINTEAVNTLIYAWEDRGLGWIAELVDKDDKRAIVNLYYGSSSYNSRQMARLIDLIVNDCKLNGIETKDQKELESIIKNWEKDREKQKK